MNIHPPLGIFMPRNFTAREIEFVKIELLKFGVVSPRFLALSTFVRINVLYFTLLLCLQLNAR
jgi:hypothetical protein